MQYNREEFYIRMGGNLRILVTNDDGIFAPGLNQLVKHLSSFAEVLVAAPDRERSATGHAITMHEPLRAVERDVPGATKSYAVSGTPADCVKLAIESLFPGEVDLVVSGINRGANLGTDVLYSGTVSGALEAVMLDVPAVAFSLCHYGQACYEQPAKLASYLVSTVWNQPWPADTLLNINIPGPECDYPKGVKVTVLGRRRYQNAVQRREDPWGGTYYWLAGDIDDSDNAEPTDVWAVQQGYVSITPIHFDLTDYKLLKTIETWQLSLPGKEPK